MGIMSRRLSSSRYDAIDKDYGETTAGNPDPLKWTLIKYLDINDYLILEVKYDGCTNYEGRKILVFKGVNLGDIIRQVSLDPHFSENQNYLSPIARFRPDKEGWRLAVRLCEVC